jgi:hypothetical protein
MDADNKKSGGERRGKRLRQGLLEHKIAHVIASVDQIACLQKTPYDLR